MGMLNNRNRKMPLLRSIHLVATIFILTIIFVSTTTTLVSASTSRNTTTSVGGGEQEAASSTTTATNNNVSNAVLGNVFMIVEFETANVNPINETYIEISTVHNVTIIPPNATTGTTINATETANTTVNILPNGLALDKGQSLIVTEGDDVGTAEQENATTTFADISRMNPDGSGAGTGVVFFSTNSTGQLAFLDNMVGLNDSEFSQGGGTIRVWEWKGETLPYETDSPPTTGNQTTSTSTLEEEE
jgi:ribosomal protein S8E